MADVTLQQCPNVVTMWTSRLTVIVAVCKAHSVVSATLANVFILRNVKKKKKNSVSVCGRAAELSSNPSV